MVLALCAAPVAAQTFYTSRADFMADPKTGATSGIDFDSFKAGSDLTGRSIGGVEFSSPASARLRAIDGAGGLRGHVGEGGFTPSSPPNVLSPGGTEPGQSSDDLRIDFATPVHAAGLDVVFGATGGDSHVTVVFLDADGEPLYVSGIVPAPDGSAGFQFVGLVTQTDQIAAIIFRDGDPMGPDDNIAYDSLVYSVVPGAGSLGLLVVAGLWAGRRARR